MVETLVAKLSGVCPVCDRTVEFEYLAPLVVEEDKGKVPEKYRDVQLYNCPECHGTLTDNVIMEAQGVGR